MRRPWENSGLDAALDPAAGVAVAAGELCVFLQGGHCPPAARGVERTQRAGFPRRSAQENYVVAEGRHVTTHPFCIGYRPIQRLLFPLLGRVQRPAPCSSVSGAVCVFFSDNMPQPAQVAARAPRARSCGVVAVAARSLSSSDPDRSSSPSPSSSAFAPHSVSRGVRRSSFLPLPLSVSALPLLCVLLLSSELPPSKPILPWTPACASLEQTEPSTTLFWPDFPEQGLGPTTVPWKLTQNGASPGEHRESPVRRRVVGAVYGAVSPRPRRAARGGDGETAQATQRDAHVQQLPRPAAGDRAALEMGFAERSRSLYRRRERAQSGGDRPEGVQRLEEAKATTRSHAAAGRKRQLRRNVLIALSGLVALGAVVAGALLNVVAPELREEEEDAEIDGAASSFSLAGVSTQGLRTHGVLSDIVLREDAPLGFSGMRHRTL
ncbi:hypothetical protein BESB_076980 [Besnoitia besnoiti]|uniref:Transmembrane protein n=1 Tax=Besnoitia besnoiti TaxID=94643 RepID=A0A2A9MAZ4_BESBE|nr:hypothetical protein BESB_076980 [Besnoitia besnoiti]PFH33481.1 hypothetical protein BESB_076980 [Besnoitia besnoiti]